MKTLCKTFGFLMLFAVLFTACGDDDDNKREYSFDADFTSTYLLKGLGDMQSTLEGEAVSLRKLLIEHDYSGSITKTEMGYKKSGMEITGLTGKDIILHDFTVNINGKERKLGNLTKDTYFDSNAELTLLEEGIRSVLNTKGQELIVKLSYRSSKDFLENEGVKFIIHYHGKFYYLK